MTVAAAATAAFDRSVLKDSTYSPQTSRATSTSWNAFAVSKLAAAVASGSEVVQKAAAACKPASRTSPGPVHSTPSSLQSITSYTAHRLWSLPPSGSAQQRQPQLG